MKLQDTASVLDGEFAHSVTRVAQALSERAQAMNIVFLDPPFKQGLLIPSLLQLLDLQLITTDTLIYLECETAITLNSINSALLKQPSPTSLKPIKQQQTNGFMYGLFQLNT